MAEQSSGSFACVIACIVHPSVGSSSFSYLFRTWVRKKEDCREDGAADCPWTAFSPVCRLLLLNGLSAQFHFNPNKSPIAYSVRIGFLFALTCFD